MSSPAPRKAAVRFVLITVALDMLALGVVIPVLPRLILSFRGGDAQSAAWWQALFGSVFAVLQFGLAPALGALSDRFGRRPLILLSNAGLALDYLLMALAPDLWWLLVGRAIAGICSASVSVPSAYIADVTPPEKRAAAFGVIGAAFGLGFVLGPALGGAAGSHDPRLPFWIAAGLCAANFAYGASVLPESLPPERRRAFHWRNANPVGALALLRSQPAVWGLAGVAGLNYVAHDSLPHTFVLYATHRFGWSTAQVSAALVAVGVVSAVVSGGLVRHIVPWLGERRALFFGLSAGALSFAIYGLASVDTWIYSAIVIGGFWSVWGASAQSLMTQQVAASEQGSLQGALAGLRAACQLATPTLMNGTFAWAIARPGLRPPGAAFLLSALLVTAALPLAALATRSRAPAAAR